MAAKPMMLIISSGMKNREIFLIVSLGSIAIIAPKIKASAWNRALK